MVLAYAGFFPRWEEPARLLSLGALVMTGLRWAFLPVLVALFAAPLAYPLRGEEVAPVAAEPAAEAAVNWPAKLREWRKSFAPKNEQELQAEEAATKEIEAIDDPAAIPAIIAALKTEKSPMRWALVAPLIKLGGEDAVAMLVKLSVEDESPQLRQLAAEGLVGQQELPQFLDKYIDYLYKPQFSTAAAQALRWDKLAVRDSVGQPLNPKLVKALIAALVQKQKKLVPYWWAVDTGNLRHMTRSGGRGTYRHRGYQEGLTEALMPTPNPEARETLRQYTSSDFQFDQSRWANELALKKAR